MSSHQNKSSRSHLGVGELNASHSQQTLEVIQKRLQAAEDDTKTLARQLSLYGFSSDNDAPSDVVMPGSGSSAVRQSNGKTVSFQVQDARRGSGTVSPYKAPPHPRSTESDMMREDYNVLVSRVCKMESSIQTLKLNIAQAQAERDLSKKEKVAANEKLSRATEAYELELQKANRDVQTVRKDYGEVLTKKKDLEELVEKLQQGLRDASSHKVTYVFQVWISGVRHIVGL